MKPNQKITKAALLSFEPCEDGLEFLKKYRSMQMAWTHCNNPDWMIWALSKFGLFDDRLARTFDIKCAYHTLHFFEEKYPKDKRPRLALESAQGFLDGKVSEQDLAAAWAAAWDAAGAAWAAVRDARWDAESKWQADTLRTLINPFKK